MNLVVCVYMLKIYVIGDKLTIKDKKLIKVTVNDKVYEKIDRNILTIKMDNPFKFMNYNLFNIEVFKNEDEKIKIELCISEDNKNMIFNIIVSDGEEILLYNLSCGEKIVFDEYSVEILFDDKYQTFLY